MMKKIGGYLTHFLLLVGLIHLVVSFVPLSVSAESVKTHEHRKIYLRAGDVNTLNSPQYRNDVRFEDYLNGGKRSFARVQLSSSSPSSSSSLKNIQPAKKIVSEEEERHQFLLHFGEKTFVDPETKNKIETLLREIGGCHGGNELRLGEHGGFLASNTYIVFCTKTTMEELENRLREDETHEKVWLGAWLPQFKSEISSILFEKEKKELVIELMGLESTEASEQLLVNYNKSFQQDVLYPFISSHPEISFTFSLVKAHLQRYVLTIEVESADSSPSSSFLTQALEITLDWLSHQTHVHFIEERRPIKLFNSNAAWIVQSGDSLSYPIYDRGLDGTGQIVGCADSGLDYDHCFFRDPNVPIPLGVLNSAHRKVVSYRLTTEAVYGDAIDGSVVFFFFFFFVVVVVVVVVCPLLDSDLLKPTQSWYSCCWKYWRQSRFFWSLIIRH
jgi:hypothetical protein